MTTVVPPQPLVVIVTGLSGSGLSTATAALEDCGFYCIDNLPTEMVDSAMDLVRRKRLPSGRVVLGMDIRDPGFAANFAALKERLRGEARLDVIFLTADPDTIISRYSTTRRRHPLLEEGHDLAFAIRREFSLLTPVQGAADLVLDTTEWSPSQLAHVLETRYKDVIPPRLLQVLITSFGFKYGDLRRADIVMDVRFLRNPFFVQSLRDLTGLHEAIQTFVLAEQQTQDFLSKFEDLLRFLLPQYVREGKHYLRIGIGCTGGKHRSVVIAETLARRLIDAPLESCQVVADHRDLREGRT